MQSILIPNPSRKRALMIIDIQPGFIQKAHSHIISNTVRLITEGDYELVICAEFRAHGGSLWEQQMNWKITYAPTPKEITDILDPKKTIHIIKSVCSVFVAKPYLAAELRKHDIEEVHIIGYDINDCVLTNANHAFDLGFFAYVIEEASESSEGDALRDAALVILRENEMTNHSTRMSESKTI
jgi:nicotinamidase-related amidase